jgi:saccharopine dehydrogenase-like NADP-dependent oxidoreductase
VSQNERADVSRKTVIVLGVGIQGRTVVDDLERRSGVGRIIAADCREEGALDAVRASGGRRTTVRAMDAADDHALRLLLAGADLVVNMLPARFEEAVLRAALDAGVHLVRKIG